MLEKSIKNNIRSIFEQQSKDGSFLSFSSPDKNIFKNTLVYRSTFSTSIILSCLNLIKEDIPELTQIKRRAIRFLMSQKNTNWSFNYWVRNSDESKKMPYPDDLDDTFCALSALFEFNPKLLNGSTIATIINLLTYTESKEGGPYRTWLTPPSTSTTSWQDIDLAVNSNIGYFLSLHDVDLPNINHMIEEAIDTQNIKSPYYPSEYPILYFISRFYKGQKKEKIKEHLFSKRHNDNWGDPLSTALVILTLLNLGTAPGDLEKSILYLIKKGSKTGYKSYGFCIDPSREGKQYFSGSSALTTAFCTAAIYQFEKIRKKTNSSQLHKEAEILYMQVLNKIKKEISSLDNNLRLQCETQLIRIRHMDKDNYIILLPYYFALALDNNEVKNSSKMIFNLCLANLYGWIAYTVYDDFLDEEGDPTNLSAASFCLRRLTSLYESLPDSDKKFRKTFHSIMNDLDNANTWEVSRCRIKYVNEKINIKKVSLPRFNSKRKLAQKSLGHALGPLAILSALGYDNNSLEFKNTLKYFTHYLIARQLNDDAHDWEEDLKKGHITYPVSLLLHRAKKMNFSSKSLHLFLPVLRELYWQEIIPVICKQILRHIQYARKALKNNFIIRNPDNFEGLIISIEKSAEEALNEQKKVVAFLKRYDTV